MSSTLGSLFSPSNENIQLKLLEKSLLVAIPLLCVFCVFWCGCMFLVCLVSVGSGCGFWFLLGQLAGLCTGHYQYFCGYRQVDSLA